MVCFIFYLLLFAHLLINICSKILWVLLGPCYISSQCDKNQASRFHITLLKDKQTGLKP